MRLARPRRRTDNAAPESVRGSGKWGKIPSRHADDHRYRGARMTSPSPRGSGTDGRGAWPGSAQWWEACAGDPTLAAWRGPWSVAFKAADATFSFADGQLHSGSTPQFVLAAPDAIWE